MKDGESPKNIEESPTILFQQQRRRTSSLEFFAPAAGEAEADDVRLVVVRVDAAVEARAVGVEVQADGAAQRRHHLERVVRRIGGAGGEAHFVRRGRRNGCAPSVVDGASSLRAISRGVSTSVATSNSVGSRERRRTLQESM